MRAASLRVAWCNSASGTDYTRQKAWDSELAAYKSAVDQGIQPAGTQRHQIEYAVKRSNETGQAYVA